MKPVRTPDTNVTLVLPGAGEDRELPATRALLYDSELGETQENATVGFVTVWQPSDQEARQLDAGACVELTIMGAGHPPVAVGVTAAVVPERELIDRGHVDRALGLLYARLVDRIIAAGRQIVTDALPDDAPRTPESEGPRCVAAIEALDTGIDHVGAGALGLPEPGAFADLWLQAVADTAPAAPTEEDRKIAALLDGLGIPDAPPTTMPNGPMADTLGRDGKDTPPVAPDRKGEPPMDDPSALDTHDASRQDPDPST